MAVALGFRRPRALTTTRMPTLAHDTAPPTRRRIGAASQSACLIAATAVSAFSTPRGCDSIYQLFSSPTFTAHTTAAWRFASRNPTITTITLDSSPMRSAGQLDSFFCTLPSSLTMSSIAHTSSARLMTTGPSQPQTESTATANHALQRTRPSRPGCNPTPSWAGSLSLGR